MAKKTKNEKRYRLSVARPLLDLEQANPAKRDFFSADVDVPFYPVERIGDDELYPAVKMKGEGKRIGYPRGPCRTRFSLSVQVSAEDAAAAKQRGKTVRQSTSRGKKGNWYIMRPRCPVELEFMEEAPKRPRGVYLRICPTLKMPGRLIRVNTPAEAKKVTEAFCGCVQAAKVTGKSVKACMLSKVPGSIDAPLGDLFKRRRRK